MAQNREPPAFQEYAAPMMARTEYRLLSLSGRGLLYTMRLECWVNRTVPADPKVLARVLGFSVDEIEAALQELQPFFVLENSLYRCPELDDYRAHLLDRKERQSRGGKVGADLTNAGKRRPLAGPTKPSPTPRVGCGSLAQTKGAKSNPDQSNAASKEGSSNADWAAEFESHLMIDPHPAVDEAR